MAEESEATSLVSPDGTYRWRLVFLPIVSMSMSILAIILGYAVGISTGSVDPFPYLPFISDLGDLRPENSVFSFFITLSCYFSWCIIIVRYYQVKVLYRNCPKTNLVSIFLGATLILGKVMVSAFQLTNIVSMHFLGAGLYFAGVTLYIGTQVYITYKNEHRLRTLLLVVRIICLIAMSIDIVVFVIFMLPDLTKYNRSGYNVAQIAEWLMAISKMAFIFSFTADFWGMKVSFQVKFFESRSEGNTEVRYQSINTQE